MFPFFFLSKLDVRKLGSLYSFFRIGVITKKRRIYYHVNSFSSSTSLQSKFCAKKNGGRGGGISNFVLVEQYSRRGGRGGRGGGGGGGWMRLKETERERERRERERREREQVGRKRRYVIAKSIWRPNRLFLCSTNFGRGKCTSTACLKLVYSFLVLLVRVLLSRLRMLPFFNLICDKL